MTAVAKTKILLGVSGSIAAFKAAALASKLAQAGFDVRVAMSASAPSFVGPATFEGLTGSRPYLSVFEDGQMMSHIHLAKWADLTLIYPASGNTIGKLAQGRADDLLGTLFLAHDFKKPYWIAPAMNPMMLAHPAVQESMTKLQSWGIEILRPDTGRMACGDVGDGRLIEPEAMLERIGAHFSGTSQTKPTSFTEPKSSPASEDTVSPELVKASIEKLKRIAAQPALHAMPTPLPEDYDPSHRILITAGGTSEAIDPVRVLTNTSTGETGVFLAERLAERRHQVTLLIAASSPFLARARKIEGAVVATFSSFEDLESLLRTYLAEGEFEQVIHAAAVSDYGVERVETAEGKALERGAKIHSGEPLRILLKPHPKLVNRLRGYAGNPKLQVVSFKLTTNDAGRTPDLSGYDSDFIVHNDVSGLERGTKRHEGSLHRQTGDGLQLIARFRTKEELAALLSEITLPPNPYTEPFGKNRRENA